MDLVTQVVSGINKYRRISPMDWMDSDTPATLDLASQAPALRRGKASGGGSVARLASKGATKLSYDFAQQASSLDPTGSAILVPHAAGLLQRAEQAGQRGDQGAVLQLADAGMPARTRLAGSSQPTWADPGQRRAMARSDCGVS